MSLRLIPKPQQRHGEDGLCPWCVGPVGCGRQIVSYDHGALLFVFFSYGEMHASVLVVVGLIVDSRQTAVVTIR